MYQFIRNFFLRYNYNLIIAFEAITVNKFRAVSSALGVMFGVASVICMLAIGNGARNEILEQLKQVGSSNIVVQKIENIADKKDNSGDNTAGGREQTEPYSPGLTVLDAEALQEIIPVVEAISPVVKMRTKCMYNNNQYRAELLGVAPSYFKLYNYSNIAGKHFTVDNARCSKPVCVIDNHLASKLFSRRNPLGQEIRVGHIWLEVIGVVDSKVKINIEELASEQSNYKVYIPYQTYLSRFKSNKNAVNLSFAGGLSILSMLGEIDPFQVNKHQLDQVVVQVEETSQLEPVADLVQRILNQRHNQVADFEVVVPELLLKHEQKTKEIFNTVLGIIAGISLLVGGIGIMNIVHASVTERIKEIGIRLAIGANRMDIKLQFVLESTFISITGGVVGVFFGVLLTFVLNSTFKLNAIVSLPSVLLAFIVSVFIGVVFGYIPAQKAARKTPVESLRSE